MCRALQVTNEMRGIKFVPDGKRLLLGWKLGTNKEVSERERTHSHQKARPNIVQSVPRVCMSKVCMSEVSCVQSLSKFVQILSNFFPRLVQSFSQNFYQALSEACVVQLRENTVIKTTYGV